MSSQQQKTVRGEVQCTGIGVHSGEKATLRLLPAPPDSGITFVRTDLKTDARTIPALWDKVVDTQLCTVLGNAQGSKIATVEHVMAALGAAGVDNAIVEVDGPEVPIMDGSAIAFVELIEMAGLQEQAAPRKIIEILRPVEIEENGKKARLDPAENGLRFAVDIVFKQKIIGAQHIDFALSQEGFKKEVACARTFGFFEDVEKMRAMGLGRGGSLDNAVVVRDDAVMNDGGLRWPDEFVRHKLLDCVGDMALAGHKIKGVLTSFCGGHALNNKMLRALFADQGAWRVV